MNKKFKAHSEFKKEHKFDEKKKSQLKKKIYRIIEKNGNEKGSEILVDYFLLSQEDENAEQTAKRRKRRASFIVALICVGTGISLICLLEVIGRRLNLSDIGRKILECSLPFAEITFTIIVSIWKAIRMPEKTRLRKDGENIAEGIIEWGKDLGHQLSQSSGLHAMILLTVTTIIAIPIAQSEPVRHIEAFVSGGMYAVAHCDDNNNATDSVMLADGGVGKVYASDEMKRYLADSDEILIMQLENAEVTAEQKSMELQLSEEDEKNIFECSGKKTDEYGTQEELNRAVLLKVEGWIAEQRDNVFDRESEEGGAPQGLKDNISRASESEQPNDSFSEVDDRLDFRQGIVKKYPKRTLMQLIANDYQRLALMLVWHEGVQSTIIYYYGQSILFDFECLKFEDNTDKTIKSRLTIIAQRYEDIAYVCPDYERAVEAGRLAEAFRYAADRY